MPELKARHAQVLESLLFVLQLRLDRAERQSDPVAVEKLKASIASYQADLEELRSESEQAAPKVDRPTVS